MKKIHWQTIYREPRTMICANGHKTYPYLLRNLDITHRNQVLAADITYIPMEKGFMYLCAIMDLHPTEAKKLNECDCSNAIIL